METEPYLNSLPSDGAKLLFKIRSNTLPTAVALARGWIDVPTACKACDTGEDEDLMHFLAKCPALQAERAQLRHNVLAYGMDSAEWWQG